MKTGKALGIFFWTAVAFLILPLFIVVPMSLSNAEFLRFPPADFGFRWYMTYLLDPQWMDATLLSVRVAVLSCLLATALGTITALGLERGLPQVRGPLLTFIGSPVVIPHIFMALGIFVLALRFNVLGNEAVLIGAHATMGLPFVVLIVLAQVQQLDVAIERAARIHGASPTRTFFSVTLPALRPSIISGAIIAFFISIRRTHRCAVPHERARNPADEALGEHEARHQSGDRIRCDGADRGDHSRHAGCRTSTTSSRKCKLVAAPTKGILG